MKDFKHTKGKWSVGEKNINYARYIVSNKRTLALIYGKIINAKDYIEYDEMEANAKLIAAAPELLENLIRCVDRLEENGMGDMSAVRRAKEAIEKATK